MRAAGPNDTVLHRVVAGVGLVLLTVLLVRTAWVSDDAFITLRTVHNALEGYGLRFNVAERVQTFTHPLWMACLFVAHGLTGGPFYGTVAVSLLTTLAGVTWLARTATNAGTLALALALLVGSKAFVDFSTSGLENPMTHLLFLAMVTSVARGTTSPADVARSTGLLSLALLNRPDAMLLVGPLWLFAMARALRSPRHLGAVVVGFLPLALWETFSLVYYGALLPNTAFAKLGTGIPRLERFSQGAHYLVQPWSYDKLTAFALLAAVPLTLWSRGVVRLGLAGAVLHAVYVVSVGGDFMAGRFWTPVVFAVALGISRLTLPSRPLLVLGALVFGASCLQPYAPIWSGSAYERHPVAHGIMDERGYYFHGAGLFSKRPPMEHAYANAGRRARADGRTHVIRATIGYFGYFAGPQMHVLDPLALADPLLARLPARLSPHWRVGHYRRAPVAGYAPWVPTPPDEPALRAVYDEVLLLTRGPLFSPARWMHGLRSQIFGSPVDGRAHRLADLSPLKDELPAPIPKAGVRLPLPADKTLVLTTDRALIVYPLLGDEVLERLDVPAGELRAPANATGLAVFSADKRARARITARRVE